MHQFGDGAIIIIIIIIILISANHITINCQHVTEQQRKAASKAVRLNGLVACDNVRTKC